MCKPGSACCGCGASSSGMGFAAGILLMTGVISAAATLITDVLTVILITVLSLAGAGSVLLVILLRKTQHGVARPLPVGPAGARARARAVPSVPVLPIERGHRLAIEPPPSADAVWPTADLAAARERIGAGTG